MSEKPEEDGGALRKRRAKCWAATAGKGMVDIDPFEIYRRLPSHQARLAAEKQVNVYYIPGRDAAGAAMYLYAVCSALLHAPFVEAVRLGAIPDFAVVVEMGAGEPDAHVKEKMLNYYGFDHDSSEAT
jgi:hypothetical protein